MPKLTLTDLTSLENQSAAIAAVNANNALIEAAIENTLSRDGTTPNTIGANLDMNSFRITNLAAPVGDNDAVRYIDIQALEGVDPADLVQVAADAAAAAASAAAALVSENNAAASAAAAALYVGAATSAAVWTTPRNLTWTGDVTGTITGLDGSQNESAALTIANSAVTNAKMANMATQTFKGRTTAGAGAPEDLTATQATAILNAMVGDSGSGGTKGLVPAPAAGDAAANKFLKADGTWAAVPAAVSLSSGEYSIGTQVKVKKGYYAGGASQVNITFTTPFTTQVDSIVLTPVGTGNAPTGLGSSPVTGRVPILSVKAGSVTVNGFTVYVTADQYDVSWANNATPFYWRAEGY